MYKSIGESADFRGYNWIKTQDTSDAKGVRTVIYKGLISNLDAALTKIKTLHRSYKDIAVSSDTAAGSATITVTIGVSDRNSPAEHPGENETRLPSITLQGGMMSVPVYQAPRFKLGEEDGITLAEIKTLDYALRERGIITSHDTGAMREAAVEYARWVSCGVKTYDAPTYTLNVTRYYKSGEAAAVELAAAGKVLTFADVVSGIPKSLIPPDPMPGDEDTPAGQWLAQAPSIAITPDAVTVTNTFIGAQKFPNFYDGGSWEPPEITYRGSGNGETPSVPPSA